MVHLPIAAVTGRALWFVIANAFTLFRLTWLPLVVLLATEWAIAYWLAWHAPSGTTLETLLADPANALIDLGTLVLEGLALSVVAVRVHRIILFSDRRPGEYFAFPFGKTEILYVLMGALSFTLIIVFVVAVIFAGVALGVVPNESADSNPVVDLAHSGKPLLVAVVVSGYFVLVWLTLRLTVWPPAVVANNRLSLGEAWRLTRGKALAMLGLGIFSTFAIIVPIAAAAYWTMTATEIGKIKNWDDFQAALPFAPFDEKLTIALAHPGRIPDPNALLLELAANFLFTTYTIAILSYAYKALKGFDAHEPIDGAGANAEASSF